MSGLGLFSSLFKNSENSSGLAGISINTAAKPEPIISLPKSDIEALKARIDDGHVYNEDSLRLIMVGILTILLDKVLPEKRESQHVQNLNSYMYALINNKDKVESIRSALLGEFAMMVDAAQAGGRRSGRRARRRSRRITKK
jgi:hypothetical protein